MTGTDWQDGDRRGDGGRPLGPGFRLWFRNRLQSEFWTICENGGGAFLNPPPKEEWWPYHPEMIDWFVDRAEDFVEWVASEYYSDLSDGAWKLNRPAIYVSLREARQAVIAPNLNAWLAADIEGAPLLTPREPSAWSVLGKRGPEIV